jgi:olefin beta-lactone synthetase
VNLASLLSDQARVRPNAAAIIERSGSAKRVTTFGELEENSRRAATLFGRHGIGAGDRVLIFQAMSPELYEALLAVFRIGATAVFLDPSAGREHIERCCELAKPNALVASWKAQWLRVTSRALRAVPQKFVIGPAFPGAHSWATARELRPSDEMFAATAETPALLTFTSGSTGQPKGAIRTHGLLAAQHRASAHALELTPGDVDLATLPIFLLANLASGVTSVIPNANLRRPGFIEAGPVLKQIVEHCVTSSVASPAFFERLIDANSGELGALKKVFTGGAPVFPCLVESMAHAMPHTKIFPVYGSTEAEPIAHLERADITADDQRAMSGGAGLLTGMPVPEIALRIMRMRDGAVGPWTRAEFEAQCVGTSEPGEIVVSGDHVLPGYLDGQGDAETKFRVDGMPWHRTGDAGRLDEHGRLWLLGRCSAVIRDDAGVLFPFAVECAAMQRSTVRRCAVVSHGGKRLLLFESDREISSEELKSALRWAQLDEVRRVSRIPMDRRHNAKVDYPALQQLLDDL